MKKRKEVPLFSLNEAAARGISRVRQPNWSSPLDHIKIDLLADGTHGPWVHVYSPFNKECNGRDPVDLLWLGKPLGMIDADAKSFYAYTGPLPDSDEYKAAVAGFDGALREVTALCNAPLMSSRTKKCILPAGHAGGHEFPTYQE